MDAPSRAQVARFAAPAAFLLAVTIAVLLVRAGLAGSEEPAATPATTTQTTTAATTTTTTAPATTRPRRRFYEIQSGDTFATVATRFDTTVEQLLILNPDVDPTELRIGQKIRVR